MPYYKGENIRVGMSPPIHYNCRCQTIPEGEQIVRPKWQDISAIYSWTAQDRNGQWWAYSHRPSAVAGLDTVWTFNESPHEVHKKISEATPNPNWRNTLTKRPPKTYLQMIEGMNDSIREAMFPLVRPESSIFDTFRVPMPKIVIDDKLTLSGDNIATILDSKTSELDQILMGYFIPNERKNDMQCNRMKTLTPLESIEEKKARLEKERLECNRRFKERITELDAIVASVNWDSATDAIKSQAVRTADGI